MLFRTISHGTKSPSNIRRGIHFMMTKDKVLDDLARVAGGTVSVLSDLGRNIREDIKSRAEDVATKLDLVPREDFERLQDVLSETRKLVEAQEKRIAALESALETTPAKKPANSSTKPATKKAKAKKPVTKK